VFSFLLASMRLVGDKKLSALVPFTIFSCFSADSLSVL
jgi:hypothetical protein